MSELVSVNKTAPPTLATVIGPFAFEKANINSELLGSLVITPIGGPYVIVTVEQYDADVQYQGGTGKVGNKRAWDSLKNGKVVMADRCENVQGRPVEMADYPGRWSRRPSSIQYYCPDLAKRNGSW